jgi:hypothetical protein
MVKLLENIDTSLSKKLDEQNQRIIALESRLGQAENKTEEDITKNEQDEVSKAGTFTSNVVECSSAGNSQSPRNCHEILKIHF